MKPYHGRITNWQVLRSSEDESLGFYISGKFLDHPQLGGRVGHTSDVLSVKDLEIDDLTQRIVFSQTIEIETRNSRYTLIS